jgi:hypothetical protein
MSPRLLYTNNGRSGYVIYKDDTGELSFYVEFGGGDYIAIIYIPSPSSWESDTKRSVAEREAIINFIGRQAVNDQATGGFYRLSASAIEICK